MVTKTDASVVFNYCPKCGAGEFCQNSQFSKKCAQCGFEYFFSPTIGVAVAAFDDDDRLLCVRRDGAVARGTLGLPGGFVDVGETIENAALREVREETGIEIEFGRIITNIPNSYVFSGLDVRPLDFYCAARIKSAQNIVPQPGEVQDVVFIPRNRLCPDDFGILSARIFIKQLLDVGN